jgi:hypothetical protein
VHILSILLDKPHVLIDNSYRKLAICTMPGPRAHRRQVRREHPDDALAAAQLLDERRSVAAAGRGECDVATALRAGDLAQGQPGFLDFSYRTAALAAHYRLTVVSGFALEQAEPQYPGVEYVVLPCGPGRADWLRYCGVARRWCGRAGRRWRCCCTRWRRRWPICWAASPA